MTSKNSTDWLNDFIYAKIYLRSIYIGWLKGLYIGVKCRCVCLHTCTHTHTHTHTHARSHTHTHTHTHTHSHTHTHTHSHTHTLTHTHTHTHTHAGQVSMIIEPTICPDPAEIYDGQNITFNCTHYGQGANITWQRNGEALPGFIESSRHRSSITLMAVPTVWSGSNISCHVDSRAHASTTLTVYCEFPGGWQWLLWSVFVCQLPLSLWSV